MNYLALVLTALGIGEARMDAKFTAVLEKQLEFVKTQTYDIVYPDLKAKQLIPVDNSAGPGAETITYRQWDEFGMAQIISNYADDLPLVDALVEEFVQRVHSIGAAYQWSIQDLRRSAMADSRLDQRKARAARNFIERKLENIGALGDALAGLTGIANNANVSLVAVTTGDWFNAATTGEQKIADLNKLVSTIVIANKETFIPDTVLLDIGLYNNISNDRISSTGDTHTTVLEAFLRSSPYIKEVIPWFKLSDANAAGTKARAVCYKRDPEILTFEIPQEFEQLPPQAKNLSFQVPVHARTAGVIVYYPIAMGYMDGLEA